LTYRETVLRAMQVAGYHDDTARFTRLLIENRVAMAPAQAAFRLGKRAKLKGIKCSCPECNPEQKTEERSTP